MPLGQIGAGLFVCPLGENEFDMDPAAGVRTAISLFRTINWISCQVKVSLRAQHARRMRNEWLQENQIKLLIASIFTTP